MRIRLHLLVLHLLTNCALVIGLAMAASPVALRQETTAPESPYRISYHLRMSEPLSHLFEVRMEIDTGKPVESIDFQIPKWSPGRYGIFDFAKNVQEFRAALHPDDVRSEQPPAKPLVSPPVERLNNQTWRVRPLGHRRLIIEYKVFGDDLSGTFSQLDARHANFNGASVFMYVVGHKPDPVSLKIDPPQGWRIINGYTKRPDQVAFEFPNYDVLIDTPTEIAPDWTLDEFKVDGQTYRVVVHSFGDEGGKRAALVRDIEKIVRAEVQMWGAAPEFESYTFLIHFDPTAARGDGMEHLNSTQIIETKALDEAGQLEETLGTVAHEFFHVWNVKRLRPAGLGPWDFTKPVETRELWIAEGLTNYYGTLMRHRAGLLTEDELLEAFSETITQVENLPGSHLMSAEEASLLASFLDRAGHEQHTNLGNTSISYYPKGEILGLTLDLLIRGRSRGRASLDDVMRRMYDLFYLQSEKNSYYLRGRNFTNEDFARVTTEVAGADLSDFFTRHVRRPLTPPYDEAFAHAGLKLERRASAHAPFHAGLAIDRRATPNAIISNVRTGSPAARAGLKNGDLIISIGNKNVSSNTWERVLNTFKQGDRVPVSVRRGSQTISTTITLEAPDNFTYHIEENKEATTEARALRAAWMSGLKRGK